MSGMHAWKTPNWIPLSANTSTGNHSNTSQSQQSRDPRGRHSETTPETRIPIGKDEKFLTYPTYVMFGTYKSKPESMLFDSQGITLTGLTASNPETRFKYNIMLPYIELSQFYYSVDRDRNQSYVFLKPNNESNRKLSDCVHFKNDPQNKYEFNIHSSDDRQHFITALCLQPFSKTFFQILKQWAKSDNYSLSFLEITVIDAKYRLRRSHFLKK